MCVRVSEEALGSMGYCYSSIGTVYIQVRCLIFPAPLKCVVAPTSDGMCLYANKGGPICVPIRGALMSRLVGLCVPISRALCPD